MRLAWTNLGYMPYPFAIVAYGMVRVNEEGLVLWLCKGSGGWVASEV